MIKALVHSIGAVLVGIVFALVLIIGVEWLGSVVHPFPEGVDPSDMEVCKTHVARCPGWFLFVAAVAWGLTTFLSAWLATRLAPGRHPAHGMVVGSFLFAMAIANMCMLPYPVWFWVLNLGLLPLAFYWGSRLGGPARKQVGI